MKKIFAIALILLGCNMSFAACITRSGESPFPFPLNVEALKLYENNWLLTQGQEISLRFNESKSHKFNYLMINNVTQERSRGRLDFVNRQLCDLNAVNPFCLYSEKGFLRIHFESNTMCFDSGLSVLGFYILN